MSTANNCRKGEGSQSDSSPNKYVFGMIYAMSSELVALRETVRGLDPTFGEVLDNKREKSPDEAVLQSLRLLDEAIQKLKADLIR